MYSSSIYLLIFCFTKLTTATEYPSDLERCHYGDTVCLTRVIQWNMHSLKDGRPDLNFPPLDPLFIEELHVVQGIDTPVNINLNLRDVLLSGLSNAIVKKVVGFGKDPSTSKFEIHGKVNKITLIGKYRVRGNVIILPVVGSGSMNLTLTNLDFVFKFIPKVEIKEGKEHLQIAELKFDFRPKRLYMEFSDLFHGDRRLSRGTNRFVNENWSVILNELRPALRKALAEVFRKATSPLFSKFPYSELFL